MGIQWFPQFDRVLGIRESDSALCLGPTVTMTPSQGFDGLADEISRTVDYYQVSLEIEALAASRPRRLIETLATDIAAGQLVRDGAG